MQRFSTVWQVLKGLLSPNLEKAPTFLDDYLLGATGRIRHIKFGKNVRIWEKELEEGIDENLAVAVIK